MESRTISHGPSDHPVASLPPGGQVLGLVDGALYALINPVVLDGRLSWYPGNVRGVTPVTCYLLLERDEALLVDTGLTAHRASLLRQLRSVLPSGMRLGILHTRLGEYGSICNTLAVLDNFDVSAVYGTFPADEWVAFEPERQPADVIRRRWQGVERPVLESSQTLALGGSGRPVHVFSSPLRLLPAHWVYDEGTRTLLTSDSFGSVFRPSESGPWIVGIDDDPSTPALLREHLRADRYWWLEQADTTSIRSELTRLLGSWTIERICPAYGCIVEGPAAVARHLALLDDVLARGSAG